MSRTPGLRREGSLRDRIAESVARRDVRQAAAALRAQQRALLRDARRLARPPAADRRGGVGPAAGRAYWPLRLPPLVTTSAQLCSVYPFVADPGLPVDGALIGTEVYSRSAFSCSLHELYRAKIITAPNAVVTGEIGSGKSSLLKCLAFRGVPFGIRFYISDVKGEYDALAAATGVVPVRVGPGHGVVMNPLAGIRRHRSQSETQWVALQRTRRLLLLEGLLEIELRSPLTEAERSLAEFALDAVTRADDATSTARMPEPTLSAVLDAAGDPARWRHRLSRLNYPVDDFVNDSRRVRLALERAVTGVIGGIFDGPTTRSASLDWARAGAILDLRDVRGSDQMTAMVTSCAQSWLEAELSAPDAPPRLCFYDEFALIAHHLPLVRRMREQVKLARVYGIGNIFAFHRFSDLAAAGSADSEQVRIARGLIEDTGVRISYRQETGSLDQAREFLGTTDVETDLLRHLRQGVGLWRIGTRSFVVKHQLSTVERPMVHTDSRMNVVPGIDNLTDADHEVRLEAAATGEAA
ncbi:hypothetical protein [Rugosimonospora africana]|uniref:ATP/GTP-binding protein n=1 Tax=Rugosimonospora africana TaxID=556532 RepID=A0A8J3QZL1_9ACTN|nr:hypothetical protein [Rugosimonospora africana]GIH18962.1 ATP/GTP-binding protein [Rugosimonospora africana]